MSMTSHAPICETKPVMRDLVGHHYDVHDLARPNLRNETRYARPLDRLTPRGPLKMYQLWPLENVPGIGGHFKMYQA
jgi:hypothetical protein